jgi:NTP pyrophosphatase (non-canonical NTP hydrolase)
MTEQHYYSSQELIPLAYYRALRSMSSPWLNKMKLNKLALEIRKWREEKGFETSWRNMPEKLMLVVTEVSEAMEAYRYEDLTGFASEIADSFIRLLDICGSVNINIEDEISSKMEANKKRPFKHGKVC